MLTQCSNIMCAYQMANLLNVLKAEMGCKWFVNPEELWGMGSLG